MWTVYIESDGFEFALTNSQSALVSLCIPLDVAIMASDKLIADVIEWFRDNGETIQLLNNFEECPDRPSTIELVELLNRNGISNSWKEKILNELDQRDNGKDRRKPPAPRPTRKPGYVYLIKSATGLYKIGRAKNLNSRVTNIQVSSPVEVELVYSIYSNDYITLEMELHQRFDHARKRGEWFALSESEVETIKSLKDET